MTLRVHALREDTTSEGPGHRFCVWVQGCTRRCPGCFAYELWDRAGGQTLTVEQLCARLDARLGQQPLLEGVTLLGGEPFEQAEPLARFARHAHVRGLSVFCFSGATLEELRQADQAGVAALLAEVDVLADGPYLQEQRSFERPWVGSRNQRFHYLTNRYDPADFLHRRNRVEVRLRRDGSVAVNGMGTVFDDVLVKTGALQEEGQY